MMALPKENENYVRLSLLLAEVCPRAIRVLFDKEFPPLQLYGKLNIQITKLCKINQAQKSLLPPVNGKYNLNDLIIKLYEKQTY